MSDPTPTDFYTAFHLRQACCQALLELAMRQAELIGEDNYHEMFEVLQSKQALIDHLGQLSLEQQPLRNAWTSRRAAMSAAERSRCDAVLTQTERLLAALLEMEQSSTQQLLARRQRTQRELQSISAGVQAQLAYQSRPPTVTSRLDVDT